MAEVVVNLLITNMASFLMEKASILGAVSNEIEEIRRELESMSSFLRDADRKKDGNEGVSAWVKQVRDVAYDVEDIIDEFLYRLDRPHRSRVTHFLYVATHLPKSIMVKNQIATKLQNIKAQVFAISERSKRYGFDRIGGATSSNDALERWHHHGATPLFPDEEDIVGIENDRNMLLKWLTQEDERRRVISVFGMGGLGKTTLITKVYNNHIVKRHFDCYAWITVSQSYSVQDILGSMIKDFLEAGEEAIPSNVGTMGYRKLVETLNKYLQDKRYLFVLDDVWSTEVWSNIKIALSDNGRGSRVVITTRIEDIASSVGDGSHVLRLQPLPAAEAWSLFCKKAFWNEPNRSCPLELHQLAHALVKKCEGLPLAIVAIGGLMSLKVKTEVEWKKVLNNHAWELSNNPKLKGVKQILSLSFIDLPYYLRHCFLYCSVFPEDYQIKRKRLIRLWVAEGFVEERRNVTMEEVAEDYLNELICRSMLLVVETNAAGRAKLLRMHDLVREISISISEKENFCVAYGGGKARLDSKARRFSIHKCGEDFQPYTNLSQLRSFFVFERAKLSSSFCQMLLRFRLLRILDLHGVSIESVPNELTDLFNLRYLSLRETKVWELPKSLGRLQNLQTLDIRDSKVERLPSGILKLQKLRHLLMSRFNEENTRNFNFLSGLPIPTGIWNLTSLQSIVGIEAKGDFNMQIKNLTQLQRLGITEMRAADSIAICESIQKMTSLLNLSIMVTNEQEPLLLEPLSPPPPLLQKLELVGHLKQVPHWFGDLRNLTHLSLRWSRLDLDPLHSLQALPKLVSLELGNAYNSKCLTILPGWLPNLRVLELWGLKHLEEILIYKGAMPNIQQLRLMRCEKLGVLPIGTIYLTTLQQLSLVEMQEDFMRRLREHRSIIKHIPDVKHYYQKDDEWFVDNLS